MTHNKDPYAALKGHEIDSTTIQEGLASDAMTDLRSQQWQNLGNFMNTGNYYYTDVYEGRREFVGKELPKMQTEYLAQINADPALPEYNKYESLIKDASIDPFNKLGDDWNLRGPDGLTGKERYEQKYATVFNNDVEAPAVPVATAVPTNPNTSIDPNTDTSSPDTENSPTPEKTLEQLQEEIQEATKESSIAYAKRMKVGFFRKSKKAALQAEFDEKREILEGLLTTRDTKLVEQLRSEGVAEDEIAQKLADESNNFVEKQDEVQRDAMLNKLETSNRPIARLCKFGSAALNSYANASGSMKFAIAGGTGIGLIIAGTTIGGAGVVGVAAVAGVRAVRSHTLSKSKMYKTPDDYEHINATVEKTPEDIIQEAADKRQHAAVMRIENGDKIKRNAVIGTLAAVGFASYAFWSDHADTLKEAAGHVKGWAGDVKDHVGGLFDGGDNDGGLPEVKPSPEQDIKAPSDTIGDALDGGSGAGAPGGTYGNMPNGEIVGDTPYTLPEAGVADSPEQFVDAARIDVGEGWYQTFGELGVANADDQAKLLQNNDLMNKLASMNMAYSDSSIGGWGIRMPADGKMPAEAADLIREAARRDNLTLSR